MSTGSRFWATSCVVLKSGRKFYVDESEYEIKKKLSSSYEWVSLTTAGIYTNKVNVRKKDISIIQTSLML